jgi:hypothetical protein
MTVLRQWFVIPCAHYIVVGNVARHRIKAVPNTEPGLGWAQLKETGFIRLSVSFVAVFHYLVGFPACRSNSARELVRVMFLLHQLVEGKHVRFLASLELLLRLATRQVLIAEIETRPKHTVTSNERLVFGGDLLARLVNLK